MCTGNVIYYRIKTNVCDCWYDGDYVVSVFAVNNYIKSCYNKRHISIMPIYRRISYLPITIHFLVILNIHFQVCQTLSLQKSIEISANLVSQILPRNLNKAVIPGKCLTANVEFSVRLSVCFFTILSLTWLFILMMCSGDIHPNPGPSSTTSSSSSSDSTTSTTSSIINFLNLNHHLSFVHYNVQSITSKLDVLYTELLDFDILAFSETWLSPAISTEDLLLHSYGTPERKDRERDRYGGIMVYIKEGIYYKRRYDLEPRETECIWIELINKHKHVLFGIFYRAPNSDALYYSTIEDSLHLAVDTGINDIIVTGDFNYNMLTSQSSRKIEDLCRQFALFQTINQPTHFTENSSSLLDLVLISNKDHLVTSGVGDPFLCQDMRYHCPIYGIFKFSKPKLQCYKRHIWSYNQGDYNLLRAKAAATDWEALKNSNINTYAQNITQHIISIAKECIPNKIVTINTSDPPWITTTIKRYIRKRKRAYRKAKLLNIFTIWAKFKKLRNKTNSMIRKSKTKFYDDIAEKLKSDSLTSKDWWTTLKFFISPKASSTIPPLAINGCILNDDHDKARVLNEFFSRQSLLDDSNAVLPDLTPHATNSVLDTIIITPLEVESSLKSLDTCKASGPNGLSNRILKELSKELSTPLCSLFNLSLSTGILPISYKEANVCSVYKKDDPSLVSSYRPISLLNSEDKVFERIVFKHLFNHLQDNYIYSHLYSLDSYQATLL